MTADSRVGANCCVPPPERLDSLGAIVRDDIARYRPKREAGQRRFRSMPDLAIAIREAALARREDGKRESHQRRIPARVLRRAFLRLRRTDLKRVRSFAELLERFDRATDSVRGIGDLYVYDTSVRIGARLGLEPEHVYLHAGTRDGAKALGLSHRAKCLKMSEFPVELRGLKPREVEDLLCIDKTALAELATGDEGSPHGANARDQVA